MAAFVRLVSIIGPSTELAALPSGHSACHLWLACNSSTRDHPQRRMLRLPADASLSSALALLPSAFRRWHRATTQDRLRV